MRTLIHLLALAAISSTAFAAGKEKKPEAAPTNYTADPASMRTEERRTPILMDLRAEFANGTFVFARAANPGSRFPKFEAKFDDIDPTLARRIAKNCASNRTDCQMIVAFKLGTCSQSKDREKTKQG